MLIENGFCTKCGGIAKWALKPDGWLVVNSDGTDHYDACMWMQEFNRSNGISYIGYAKAKAKTRQRKPKHKRAKNPSNQKPAKKSKPIKMQVQYEVIGRTAPRSPIQPFDGSAWD